MKKHLMAMTIVIGSAVVFSPWAAAQTYTPKTLEEKKSFLVGYQFGANFHEHPFKPNVDVLVKGLIAGMKGEKLVLSDEEVQQVTMAIQQQIMDHYKKLAEETKKAGEAYLAKSKKQPGVISLPSGLQYKVLARGTGGTPKADGKVTVHYEGTLTNGTVFDSSYQRKEPLEIQVDQVIKGWTEALQRMKVGDKWQLIIPSELAYGENPPPGSGIPQHSVLLFTVELLKVH